MRLAETATVGAEATLKLDKKAGDVPVDSPVAIRPRSVLGLKYVELTARDDRSARSRDGDTLPVAQATRPGRARPVPEHLRRAHARRLAARTSRGFGDALRLPRRGLNETIEDAPRFLAHLEPVMRRAGRPRHAARAASSASSATPRASSRPVADRYAHGFTAGGGHVRGVVARPRPRSRQTIEKSAPTLTPGIRVLPRAAPVPRRPRALLARDEARGRRAAARAAADHPRAARPASRCCGARRRSTRSCANACAALASCSRDPAPASPCAA